MQEMEYQALFAVKKTEKKKITINKIKEGPAKKRQMIIKIIF